MNIGQIPHVVRDNRASKVKVGAMDPNRHGGSVNRRYLTFPSTTHALMPPNPNELLIM